MTLGPFDLLPLMERLLGVSNLGIREDMGVPAGHLPE